MKPASRFRPRNATAQPPICQPPPEGIPTMKMRRASMSESGEDAATRAETMPWWPRVVRRRPYCVGPWWCWTIEAETTKEAT